MRTVNKNELRNRIIHRLKSVTNDEKFEIESKLANQLFQSSVWKNAKTIGITCATRMEWDTETIIQQAWKENKIVTVPKVDTKQKSMNFHRIESFSQIEIGYANIKEPITEQTEIVDKQWIDLIIVPGIVFDRRGYRIGFGGGYYDRFLIDFEHETASLVSHLQLVDHIPAEKHDIPVQYIVTENRSFDVKENWEEST